jgi:hypothetical protein
MMVTRQIRRRRIRQHSSSEGEGEGNGNDDCCDGDDHCDIMPSTVLLLRQSSSSPSRSILLSLVLLFLFTTPTTCTGQGTGTGTGTDLSSSSSSQSELDSIAEASIAYSMCFTGPSQAVTLNEATGELTIFSAVINNDDNDDNDDNYNDSSNRNRSRNRNLRRGGLRQQQQQQFRRTSSTDSSLNDFSMIVQKTNPAMIHHRDRGLSLDGSNSLTFTSSGNDNQDDINNNTNTNSNSTTKVFYARECSCYGDNSNDQNNDNKKIALFCDEESDYCGLSLSADGKQKVECYTVSKLDSLTRNIWPLIWILYCLVFVSCLCTFHGRIVLDFIKGTILYYCCGFGDRFGNRSLRSVNRYNYSIVQEILDEERYDRSQVLRTRRDGTTQAAQQMDAIANAAGGATTAANNNNNAAAVSADVPPTTIMTNNSIEMDNIVEDVDVDEEEQQQQEDVSAAAAAATTSTGMLSRFRNYVNNIEWPWQHSWKRYIRYNLLMRVEWIAQRDEVAFINSRQQRGLPHARYEMKIRKWNSQEGCTNAGGCSIVGGSLAQFSHCSSLNSVDEPHCTICFSELEDGDRVGDIGCMHVFHADCLKMWIQKRNSCPLCNIPVAKRRRISSEELNKEAIDEKEANTNNDNAAAAAAALLLLQEERDINSGSGTTANTSLAASNHLANHQHDDTDNYNYSIPVVSGDALQPMDGAATNMPPTRQRLLHMPMTPSTLAAEDSYDSYSSYSDEYEMNDDDDNSSIGGVNGSPSSSGFTVSNDRKQSIDDGEMTDDVEVKDDDDIDVVDDGNNHEELISPDNTLAPDAAVDESHQQEQEQQQQQPNLKFLQFQGSHLQSPPRQIRQRRSSSSTTRPQNSTNNNILTGHDGAVVGMDDGVQHENENEEEEKEDDGNEENVNDDNDISFRPEEQREGEDDDLHHLEEDTNDGDEEKE